MDGECTACHGLPRDERARRSVSSSSPPGEHIRRCGPHGLPVGVEAIIGIAFRACQAARERPGAPELRRSSWQFVSRRGPDALRCNQNAEMEAPGAAHAAPPQRATPPPRLSSHSAGARLRRGRMQRHRVPFARWRCIRPSARRSHLAIRANTQVAGGPNASPKPRDQLECQFYPQIRGTPTPSVGVDMSAAEE